MKKLREMRLRLLEKKTPPPRRDDDAILLQGQRLLPVVLDPGRPQACEAMLIDGMLPAQEFLGRERIALTRFFEAQQTAANSGDDFGFPADDPTACVRRGKICDCQRAAVRPNDILDPRTMGIGHDTLT
jgi:hypothetical protein